jgi:hypothetical protein
MSFRQTPSTHSILALQNKDQLPGDTPPDPSQIIQNGSSPGFPFIVKPDDNDNAVASVVPSGAPDQAETDPSGSMSYKSTETPSPIIRGTLSARSIVLQLTTKLLHWNLKPSMIFTFSYFIDNGTSQQQAHQPISSPAEDRVINNEMFSNPELAIDEGTISLSSQYSQEYVLIMSCSK